MNAHMRLKIGRGCFLTSMLNQPENSLYSIYFSCGGARRFKSLQNNRHDATITATHTAQNNIHQSTDC